MPPSPPPTKRPESFALMDGTQKLDGPDETTAPGLSQFVSDDDDDESTSPLPVKRPDPCSLCAFRPVFQSSGWARNVCVMCDQYVSRMEQCQEAANFVAEYAAQTPGTPNPAAFLKAIAAKHHAASAANCNVAHKQCVSSVCDGSPYMATGCGFKKRRTIPSGTPAPACVCGYPVAQYCPNKENHGSDPADLNILPVTLAT